jgi:hypothetical protein
MGKVLNFVISPIGAIIGGTAGKILTAASLVVAGIYTGNPQLIMAGIGMGAAALAKKPKTSPAAADRLNASVVPGAPRKFVFGNTAFAADVRYAEWDSKQEYFDEIICCASHRVQSFQEIWFDDKLAWTAAGGAQGEFAGYLTVDVRTEGNAGNTIAINGGGKWGATRRLTGCAYIRLRFKVVGNSKKKESPFGGSIPSRMTIIGEAAPVYDVRFDSTRGGNGTMRAEDQTTWRYTYDGVVCGRNPAAQVATYLLGYRINGLLAVGCGIPPERIDFSSFITAANACDEPVALAAGGTEPRYRTDGIFSEFDDPTGVLDNFLTAMNGVLRDTNGQFSLTVLTNDLAVPRFAFDDNDVLGEFEWQPDAPPDQAFNEVRGQFTNPSRQALFQMVDYPRVRIASTDGIERIHPFDLALVQSASQAQRLAKQQLARIGFPGRFSCDLGHRGWAVQLGDVVTLTFSALGWQDRIFRVVQHTIAPNGVCPVVLREENADIYLWDADERPVVQPVQPVPYDPSKSVLMQLLVAGEIDYADGSTVQGLQPGEAGANVTQNHTSANTAFVGDRSADAVNYDLDTVQAGVAGHGLTLSQILLDVDALEATYGSTASAATSASAAAAAQAAAETARNQAQTARDAAGVARDAAQAAQATAQGAATTATTQALAAGGSASAAAGSATTATNQASAAAGSATAAAGSATAAQTSAGSASTSAGQSATSATNAAGSASAAAASAVTAAAAQTAAGNSATAAASSASAAAGSATTAGTQASAALSSATNAATSAGNAATSAGQSATSATNAAGSASSASASATVAASAGGAAQEVANLLLPSRPSAPEQFLTVTNAETANAQLPAATPFLPTTTYAPGTAKGTNVTVAAEGVVREYSVHANLYSRGWLPVGTGRTFRVTFRTRMLTNGGTTTNRGPGIAVFGADGVLLTGGVASAVGSVAAGWETLIYTVTSAAIVSLNASAAYVRARGFNGRETSSSNTSGATWQTSMLRIEDVTSETAASDSATAAATSASSAAGSATAAGNSASAAQTSATNASTSAGAAAGSQGSAATSASQASTSASNAAGSASAAGTSQTNAANSATAAGGSASAAAGSASSASTSATNAGNSATAASGSAVTASTQATNASSSASAAASSAAAASASAVSASNSATLVASISLNSLNSNPQFLNFPGTTSPADWIVDAGSAGTRVAGEKTNAYAWQVVVAAAGDSGYARQVIPSGSVVTNAYLVLEADVQLVAGSLAGSGLQIGTTGNFRLAFAIDPDSKQGVVGAGTVGNTYRFRKLLRITGTELDYFYAINNLPNVAWGNGAAKTIKWLRAAIRPATDQEIAAKQATTDIATLQASVSVQSGVLVNLQGRALAYLQQTVNAGSSATAFLELRAEASFGAGTTSNVALGAREVHVYTEAAGGGWRKTLSISGNDVLIDGNLTATAGMFLGSGTLWRPALAMRDFQVTDGTPVTFGLNIGTGTLFTFRGDNLAPLNTGETYKLYADAVTGTGFTPRLRIATPGATTSYSLTVDTVPGTGPTRQIDKAANPDASNNVYRLRFQGTFTATATQTGGSGGSGGGWGGWQFPVP